MGKNKKKEKKKNRNVKVKVMPKSVFTFSLVDEHAFGSVIVAVFCVIGCVAIDRVRCCNANTED